VKVGDVYTTPRGKRYCVFQFVEEDWVTLSDEHGGKFDMDPRMMVPENGWTLVSAAREQEA
jgi:hypothetical protein